MADLEERVATLEREMTALRARVDTVEEDSKNIPDLIKTEFRLSNSQIARLSRDVAELRDLPAKVEALPRVVAGLVVEMLSERGTRADLGRVRRALLTEARANCRPSAAAPARVGSVSRLWRA